MYSAPYLRRSIGCCCCGIRCHQASETDWPQGVKLQRKMDCTTSIIALSCWKNTNTPSIPAVPHSHHWCSSKSSRKYQTQFLLCSVEPSIYHKFNDIVPCCSMAKKSPTFRDGLMQLLRGLNTCTAWIHSAPYNSPSSTSFEIDPRSCSPLR